MRFDIPGIESETCLDSDLEVQAQTTTPQKPSFNGDKTNFFKTINQKKFKV